MSLLGRSERPESFQVADELDREQVERIAKRKGMSVEEVRREAQRRLSVLDSRVSVLTGRMDDHERTPH